MKASTTTGSPVGPAASTVIAVTDGAAVTEGVGRIEADAGPIDILVNTAAMQRRAPLEQFDEAHWHGMMKTNVDSVFLVGQAVARHMIDRRRGKIINICSVQSELGRPNPRMNSHLLTSFAALPRGMRQPFGLPGG